MLPDPDQLLARILRKVRRIELRTRRRVESELSGDYHSSFRGQGIDFHDYRAYLHGDDARALDWNVTARLGEPYVRTFTEERQKSVLLLVDISGSTEFGTGESTRREFACEVAAHLAFSALDNKDLVGLALFSDRVEHWVHPGRGRQHGLRLLRDILVRQPSRAGSNLAPVLESLLSPGIPRSLVFLLSDFLVADCSRPLRLVAQRHELICLHLLDPAELNPPPLGKVIFQDAETQQVLEVDTTSPQFRRAHQTRVHAWQDDVANLARRSGASFLALPLDQDPGRALHGFFQHHHRSHG